MILLPAISMRSYFDEFFILYDFDYLMKSYKAGSKFSNRGSLESGFTVNDNIDSFHLSFPIELHYSILSRIMLLSDQNQSFHQTNGCVI